VIKMLLFIAAGGAICILSSVTFSVLGLFAGLRLMRLILT